jgi:hypothetical protein
MPQHNYFFQVRQGDVDLFRLSKTWINLIFHADRESGLRRYKVLLAEKRVSLSSEIT